MTHPPTNRLFYNICVSLHAATISEWPWWGGRPRPQPDPRVGLYSSLVYSPKSRTWRPARSSAICGKAALCYTAIFIACSAAHAANFGCNANAAAPALIRGEGSAELVGDLVLTCTGGTRTPAGQSIPQSSITVTLNATITSRMMTSAASEALLLIDEPGSAANPAQLACGSVSGCFWFVRRNSSATDCRWLRGCLQYWDREQVPAG